MDKFTIVKTKLDSSFPESQLLLPEIRKPFRLDVTGKKGGLLVFVNNDIPSKYLRSFHLLGEILAMPSEIKLKQPKLMVISIYQHLDQNLVDQCLNPIQDGGGWSGLKRPLPPSFSPVTSINVGISP